MALARLLSRHSAYLERTARKLSARRGSRVSEQDVLHALLDLAIQDEGIYDPQDPGRPLDPLRRAFLQADTNSRTTHFSEKIVGPEGSAMLCTSSDAE